MRDRRTISLEDFYEGPRQALFYCQEPVLPPSCRRVGEFLLARWPEITLRTASTEEDLRASLRQSAPDLLFIDSHGDSELDLLQLERITPDLKQRTLVLLARPSGSLMQADVSLPSLEQGECLGGRAADFLEDRIRARARHRYEKYRRERLRRMNERLRQLSLEDPLTRIFNRRGFFRFLKSEWSRASRYETDIACVVIDIDHFKRLNDTYGHAVGDWMLRGFSSILKSSCRTSDILGRVGGEEFCVILPSCTEHQAILWAEKTRQKIANTLLFAGEKSLRVTASFGVASCQAPFRDEHALIDLADRAMLVAKHGGRNRVIAASSLVGRKFPPSRTSPSSRIVRLLLDSLAIRDPETARHSQRVSQYSTLLAKQLGLGENEIWIAEVGALLHDIGKMGLPDRVLQKRSTLDPSERELVNLSLDTSYDIARNAFGDGPVSEAVRGSRVWFQDSSRFNGGRLPIAARIVAIADAYDAMTSPHSYREGFSREQAIQELERCSGTQFDGELVRHFNAMVNVHEG